MCTRTLFIMGSSGWRRRIHGVLPRGSRGLLRRHLSKPLTTSKPTGCRFTMTSDFGLRHRDAALEGAAAAAHSKPWPHAPVHRLDGLGAYMVTAGTYQKKHHLNASER